MFKKILKVVIIIIVSFLATFYNKDGLNIILAIPLVAFFMFNGLNYFLISLSSMAFGFFYNYLQSNEYYGFVNFLIALCIYFFFYYLLLIFNKKLIINYFTSCVLSIVISYFIYYLYSFDYFTSNILIVLFLACIITFLFSFLIKKFSFHLLIFKDESSLIILFSLLSLFICNIIYLSKNVVFEYICLGCLLLLVCIFALKNTLTNVLALNSSILILSFLFNQAIISSYIYLIILISSLLSLNKSKYNYLNSLLALTCFIIYYLIKPQNDTISYLFVSAILTLSLLFINPKHNDYNTNNYYKQYVKNKNEMLFQLQNFQTMFVNIGDNFKKAKHNRILQRAKEEVFNTLCFNCSEMENCHKKGKHLLLNYIKDSLNNNLDENKIRYIKQNCVKQETYFKLLDKFTNTYLIKNYQKEDQTKMKDIISSDFYSFAKIMEKCCNSFINDKLILANNFYKNINDVLLSYKFDVVFINNLSTEDTYKFEIAIKDIKYDEIEAILLPIINETLQAKMEVISIDLATLSFSYFIISIKEIDRINVNFAVKQSNEDIKANGDSYTSFNTSNNFYIAISDGMGNGLDANEESKFTLDTLFSMIKTKMGVKSSILLTNDLIQLKNDFESYTTLDLLSIDKQTKIATFYKLGAFNAYIIRNHSVTEVNNYSLPLGILDDIFIHPTSYKLEKDDIIIMCSDGMIDDTNKDIIPILEDIIVDSPKVICNTLFSHLIDIRQNSDDATLIVITIS